MEKQKAIEQAGRKINLTNEIDETIKVICKTVRKDAEEFPLWLPNAITALAELINARAKLN